MTKPITEVVTVPIHIDKADNAHTYDDEKRLEALSLLLIHEALEE